MQWFTIQISNHPKAGSRIPPSEAASSWQTVYDGELPSAKEARRLVDELSKWARNSRCFKGKSIGKFHYAVLR